MKRRTLISDLSSKKENITWGNLKLILDQEMTSEEFYQLWSLLLEKAKHYSMIKKIGFVFSLVFGIACLIASLYRFIKELKGENESFVLVLDSPDAVIGLIVLAALVGLLYAALCIRARESYLVVKKKNVHQRGVKIISKEHQRISLGIYIVMIVTLGFLNEFSISVSTVFLFYVSLTISYLRQWCSIPDDCGRVLKFFFGGFVPGNCC